jgi:polyribonucleotide nucleotidyltransferase
MDFKVAGTTDFVTAIQLDMKVTGLPQEVLAGALKQAKDARLFILDTIAKTLPGPRETLSSKAPRVVMIQIPVDKIGEVIGPKGKRINEISAMTGADINIEDDGRVFVGAREGVGAEEAIDMIEQIVNPRLPEVGERFEGKVVKTTEFGAFVALTPVRDGLLHISKLGRGKRLSSVEEAVKTGDTILVEVESIDAERGRIALKPVGEGWDPPEGGWPRVEGEDRGDRPPRDRDRRPRDRDRGGRGRREGGGDRQES